MHGMNASSVAIMTKKQHFRNNALQPVCKLNDAAKTHMISRVSALATVPCSIPQSLVLFLHTYTNPFRNMHTPISVELCKLRGATDSPQKPPFFANASLLPQETEESFFFIS